MACHLLITNELLPEPFAHLSIEPFGINLSDIYNK